MLPGLLALWVEQLAAPLHGRNSWRMARLVAGIALAQGRRTVTSWLRAAGITDGYRSYYPGSISRCIPEVKTTPVPLAKQEPPPRRFNNEIGMEFVIAPTENRWPVHCARRSDRRMVHRRDAIPC